MNKFFVYILKSDLGFHYIGQTSNLRDRLNRHNSKRSTYTKNKCLWEVVAYMEVPTRAEAVQLLKNFKNYSKALDYILQISEDQ
jgi:putative endonuclease